MAIEQLPARLPRELPAPGAFRLARALPLIGAAAPPRHTSTAGTSGRLSRAAYRSLEILPGFVALTLIAGLFSGYIWFPDILAAGLILFDLYWLWKSWTIAFHVVKGVRLIRQSEATDWRHEYRLALARRDDVLPWDGHPPRRHDPELQGVRGEASRHPAA